MRLEDYVLPPQGHISAQQVLAVTPPDAPIFVVLDDDPTGSQSVADLPILTRWEVEDFTWALTLGKPAVYVITNTRAMEPHVAHALIVDIVTKALAASEQTGKGVTFVSRSDSTLRSQFPVEVNAIQEAMGKQADGIILLPAFPDAGRVTINGVHMAQELNGQYVQVATTDFAQDKTFGYEQSFLPRWVEEKTGGAIPNSDVALITLEMLRTEPDAVYDLLANARDQQVIAVDCITEADMRALSIALSEVEHPEPDSGYAPKTFIYQVGPPFVRARIGQDVAPPLTADAIEQAFPLRNTGGGLIVVGSHVQLTSRQLAHLRDMYPQAATLEVQAGFIVDIGALATPVEADASAESLREALANPQASAHIDEVIGRAVEALETQPVIIHTSRTVIAGQHELQSLIISNLIAEAVVAITQGIMARRTPRFVIAKGGITSSDMAAKGLAMRRGHIVGPLGHGIISLIDPFDGPGAHMPFVIFAGNVGDVDSLTQVVQQLMR